MALSFIQVEGNGSTREFAVPFPYIAKDHVKATVNTVQTSFTWLNPNLIQFALAPPLGAVVEIRRETPNTAAVDFVDGSTLTEEDLDRSAQQLLFLSQETRDKVAANLSLTTTGTFDARNRRISGALDPIDDQDLVTKKWAETGMSSQLAVATGAAGQAEAARDVAVAAGMAVQAQVPVVRFRRPDPDATDTLLRDLVWQQGRTVAEFGGVQNGATDASTALEKAIAALPAAGGVVWVPPSDMPLVINGGLTITKPNVAIIGSGPQASKIIMTSGHNATTFLLTANGFRLSGFNVQAYGVTGNTQHWLVDSANGSCYATVITDIEATDLHSIARFRGASSQFKRIVSTRLKPVYGVGASYDCPPGAELHRIFDIHFGGNTSGAEPRAGFELLRGAGFEMSDIQMYKCGTPILAAPVSDGIRSIHGHNVWCDTSSGPACLLDGRLGSIGRVAFGESWFSSCQRGVVTYGDVLGVALDALCEVYDNYYDGILLNAGTNTQGFVVNGSAIAGNGARNVADGGGGGTGFVAGDGVSDWHLLGCNFGGYADFGINTFADVVIGTGCTGYRIIANRFRRAGAYAGIVYGHTAGADKTVANNLGWSP